MRIPTIAIVGHSNSGKTRVATALIHTLAVGGYCIAAVKHCHLGHQVDQPTKDSARLFAAGAARIVASSPGQITSVQHVEGDLLLEQVVASLAGSYDLVVAEGFKNSSVPKVLVLGTEPASPWPEGVIAVVSDDPVEANVPIYTFGEVDRLAEQILMEVLRPRRKASAISLVVDGVWVPLSAFPSSALEGVVLGFIKALKDVTRNPRNVRITLDLAEPRDCQEQVAEGVCIARPRREGLNG